MPDLAIAGIVWTLEKFCLVEKSKIRKMITPILAARRLICSSKGQVLLALAIYTKLNVDRTDEFIAAQMKESARYLIYSYDRDFDKLSEAARIEP